MSFIDKTLNCRDCQSNFLFTADEQEFFAIKELKNEPGRCPNCRVTRKFQREGRDMEGCSEVPCFECGAIARVPFKPTGIKPVFCRYCMQRQTTKDAEAN